MNWSRIRALVAKDLKEVRRNRMVVLPMAIVPLVLCVILPVAGTLAALLSDVALVQGANFIEGILGFYPIPPEIPEGAAQIVYVFLNFTFVPFFLLVPIMVTSVISANSVVGEKERKTLETLLYTPITNREFLVAKLLSAFLPALAVAYLAFAVFFVGVNALSLGLGGFLLVQSVVWIPTLLLLVPSIAALGLSVSLLVSLKAKTFMEAQQAAGVLVLPIVLLVGGQVAGLFVVGPLSVIILALVLAAPTYVLLTRVGPRFHRERVITTL